MRCYGIGCVVECSSGSEWISCVGWRSVVMCVG